MIPIVVLAGGRATRLGTLSEDAPKFLAPLNKGRVFADVQLDWLRTQGFEDVRLSVGYRAEQIQTHCGDGSRYGLRLTYCLDGAAPLGTGGAVRNALRGHRDWAAIIYGDTLLALDCRDVVRQAKKHGPLATMTVMRDPPAGHACNAHIEADGHLVYDKKAPLPQWRHIDYGFSVVSAEFLALLGQEGVFDLAVAQREASQRKMLYGYETKERFWEINTPEALAAFAERFS